MTAPWLAAAAFAAVVAVSAPARASLTPSETEQIRHDVATASELGRVRALVARPDLTAREAAAAMSNALTTTGLDPSHVSFLHELVFGTASTASRPVLAAATVAGTLARADALLAQHPLDLDRTPGSVFELQRAYAFIEEVARSDGSRLNITAAARADCAGALAEHIKRHASILAPEAPVSARVAAARAQAAVALFDLMPEGTMRRVDAADKLGLTGGRRALLVELGLLSLDAGGPDSRVAPLRAALERLPGAREGLEAFCFCEAGTTLSARDGEVIIASEEPGGASTESSSLWGSDAEAPQVDARTVAIARALSAHVVARAFERRPELAAVAERDGGSTGVATFAAMLEVDAQRTVEVAAARLLAGEHQSVARLADAIGALAVFAPPAGGPDGLWVPVGRAKAGLSETARLTHVSLGPSGAAVAFRFDAHAWRLERDDSGVVSGIRRDGALVVSAMLPAARAAATEAKSWSAAGLVFARLAGSPRAVITAGPHVRLVGTSAIDAIASPSPGDDIVLETELRIGGGPAGVVVRALPTASGFKGASIVILPGPIPRAALLVADGAGVETAAAPIVELSTAASQRVRVTVRGNKIEATVGVASVAATLPTNLAHGDVALRAYPGASVEASGWRVTKSRSENP